MNRPIKFQFYIHSESRMIDAIGFCFESETQIRIWYKAKNSDDEVVIRNESFAAHNVSQREFTGITHKSGTLIYEGDILGHVFLKLTYNWLVSFKDGCFCVQSIGIDGYLHDFFRIDSPYYFTDREIIGNQYQNPELLKK